LFESSSFILIVHSGGRQSQHIVEAHSGKWSVLYKAGFDDPENTLRADSFNEQSRG
jgi:hypothetical protein